MNKSLIANRIDALLRRLEIKGRSAVVRDIVDLILRAQKNDGAAEAALILGALSEFVQHGEVDVIYDRHLIPRDAMRNIVSGVLGYPVSKHAAYKYVSWLCLKRPEFDEMVGNYRGSGGKLYWVYGNANPG